MDFVRIKRKPMSDINVVPYIDVMLVLLVIFMITAPMLMQGVDVALPQTDSDALQLPQDKPPLIVSVDSYGAYYVELGEERSKPLELGELANKVKAQKAEDPQLLVLVRGDTNASYGTVVNLMAILRSSGVKDVGLITEQPK
ncbi:MULTISPECIES: protein TolR [Allohahella]|uniref:Tol-Pal system protein TolR n=1 Tax=Allohahella marinimesophila TaxID=1054972 RepID=A0ABP7NNX7_9GAMM|nr:protein TolR [Hahellaceae bacterium]|tara:strand:- start:59565 stop:59990 length:426 start_codon:yes stop_codon:yes gene_type:complete